MSDYKISELTAHPTGLLGDDDLIEVSYYAGGVYYSRKMTGAELKDSSSKGLIYKALLTQSGTNAPTAEVLQNTLGGVPTFGYTSTGVFTMSLTGAFTDNETHVMFNAGGKNGFGRAWRVDNDTIRIESYNTSFVLTNSILEDTALTIEVFPNYIS